MLPASSCTCDQSVVGTSSSLHPAKPYSRAALTRLGEIVGLTLINADSPLSSSWSMLGGAELEAREPRRGTYQRAPPPVSDPSSSTSFVRRDRLRASCLRAVSAQPSQLNYCLGRTQILTYKVITASQGAEEKQAAYAHATNEKHSREPHDRYLLRQNHPPQSAQPRLVLSYSPSLPPPLC